ncbi:MAG: phosphoribosylformylglycinamidine synthase subunit PurQ [Firmicutes bacterium]|nr:phosphoribosylformylglycinamidine synthase subunit PurQ [Bacillota bacterium]
MKIGIVVYPGSNCDRDCQHVLADVLGLDAELIWHDRTDLAKYDALILPGGFSYGDYLRSGAIARFSPVTESVISAAQKGVPVLGICNGFQVLLEAGLLPGAMLVNDSLHFRCHSQYVRVERDHTPFTYGIEPGTVLEMPVAHGEGNYYLDPVDLAELEEKGQVIFRYVDAEGRATPEANPNGSVNNIAGICNEQGNVVGLMPHPERASEAILGSADGLKVFQALIKFWEAGQ